MIKLSDYVMKFIAGLGVRHVFMLPGGGCMHLIDSLGTNPNIEYVCNLHEQASAIAAEAYGQYHNKIGVALVTTGPGGTNAITGVAGAWIDSTPCLIISGQVKRADMIADRGVRQMGVQEVDIVSMVKPITKYAVTILDPNSISYHLEKAIYLAKTGRPGPVWIDIPLDVQASMIDEENIQRFDAAEVKIPPDRGPVHEQITETIRLLNQADRPVILAGNGIRIAKAEQEFLQLVELLGVPVLTTWKAIDLLPEEHNYFFGRPGSIGQRGANFIQQNSDWLLTIGARLDLAQTGYNHMNFARGANKVIVDIDPAEINKMEMPINVPVCADAKKFIREFIYQREHIKDKDRFEWLAQCRNWKTKYPVVLQEYLDQKDYVNTYALIEVLSYEMTNDDILVPGSAGASSEITMQAFKVKQGQRILNSPGLGAMGFGLSASIGACLAGNKKRTICINGDGGFQLNMQELETVKRLDLPIKFFILNNQGYASIRATQRNYFNGRYVGSEQSSRLTFPDMLKIADAYGIPSIRIAHQRELLSKVREVFALPGPVICEVMVIPDQPTAPRMSAMKRADGSMVSKPLEDLWPYLDREEFKTNMMVNPIEE